MRRKEKNKKDYTISIYSPFAFVMSCKCNHPILYSINHLIHNYFFKKVANANNFTVLSTIRSTI